MYKLSLTEYCRQNRTDIIEKLKLCIDIAVKADEFHKNNIIYSKLSPDKIFIDIDKLEISLTPPSKKNNPYGDKKTPEEFDINSLKYLSPEATGRIDTPVDYRSDFYSMGAIYYEIFSGSPPFPGSDPAGIIHAHLAGNPVPLHKKNSAIPESVSGVVLKLLEKNPDERYQSLSGIVHDLKTCLDQLSNEGKIGKFALASHDISPLFRIPEKLYGRHKEIGIIVENFSKSEKGQSRYLFLSGPPGIGKSFLAHEVMNILRKEKTYFISGKFEQFNNTIPYTAFIQAFQSLIRQLLTENEACLADWKIKIRETAGVNGKILTDIFPDLIHIIGPQKEIEEISPQETQNRFKHLLYSFICLFADKDHTLVIFIDDLQWADQASIELIKLIFSDTSLPIFLISAYRDAETAGNNYLTSFLNSLGKDNYPVIFLDINPVNSEYASALLEDIFHNEMEDNSVFIELLLQKTNGNPLFIKEILLQLHRLGHIYRHTESTGRISWSYMTEEINNVRLPETLAEILANRISLLPEETQDVLKIASCIGIIFSPHLIAGIQQKEIESIKTILNDCVKENLLLIENKKYSFIHDKVQETVYSLIPENGLTALHYKIGSLLLELYEAEDEYLFEIVTHLNRSLPLIKPGEETGRLINLNYRAALKAKKSNAFDSMLIFLKTGISLLGTDCWTGNYKTTFLLYKELMECESILKNFIESDNAFNELIQHAESDLARAEIYSLSVQQLNASGEYQKAIEHARSGLKILNNHLFDFKSSIIILIIELLKFKLHYTHIKIDSILEYPENTEVSENIAAKIFINLAPALSLVDIIGSLILLFRIHNYYLKSKKQVVEDIPANFMGIAIAVATALNDYRLACRFGELSLQSLERYNNNSVKCRMIFLFAFSINHWKRHARSSIDLYIEAYNSSFTNGDFYSAANSIHSITAAKLIIGHTLKDLVRYYDLHKKVMAQLFVKNNINILMYDITMRIICRLISGGEDATKTGESDDFITGNSIMAIFIIYVTQMKIQYLFEEHDLLLINIPFLEKNEKNVISSIHLPEYKFCYSLSITSLWAEADSTQRRKFKSILKKNQKKMKTWAKLCPENFLHKYLLVQAELSRVTGKDQKDETGKKQGADTLYDMAIQSAHEQEYINNEAIANECAGKYYLSLNIPEKARDYLFEAIRLYNEWGADAKCRHMTDRYFDLPNSDKVDGIHDRSPDKSSTIDTNRNVSLQELDLESIQSAAAGMSGIQEVELAIKKVLSILCESSGARRAVLIFYEGNEISLYASVETTAENENIFNLQKGINQKLDIPLSIIRFVKNTSDTINLDNPQDNRFLNDPFINKNKIKSVLCKRLLKLENKEAIMYLENDRLPNLFNDKRMALINTITIQLTAVLENILLKEMLVDKNAEEKTTEIIPIENILESKYSFTIQEIKIALMLKNGVSREDVCDELTISYKTLKNHLYSMYAKSINLDEDDFSRTGRIDKLSRFLLFLMKLEK
jgi:predicted ATPase/GAF domain-containing protein